MAQLYRQAFEDRCAATGICRSLEAYLEGTTLGFQDATCYESRISFPTDVKLLWECCHTTYQLVQQQRRALRLRKSRMNYERHKQVVQSYQRTKKKTRRKEKKLRKKLLKFLGKLLQHLEELPGKRLSNKQQVKLKHIEKVREQQYQRLYGHAAVKDRIVSLSKPYIRPIVRGKEVKAVEFGAKVNVLQVGGINFIEHLSYDAFHEGIRLTEGIRLHRRLFGRCTHQSADRIYATNANRSYCTQQKIGNNFIPKGRQKPQHVEQAAVLRKTLNVIRSTVLEGSFGNEKNHYLLQKIPARNQTTETAWIFFGIFTSNAVRMAGRMETLERQARAA